MLPKNGNTLLFWWPMAHNLIIVSESITPAEAR